MPCLNEGSPVLKPVPAEIIVEYDLSSYLEATEKIIATPGFSSAPPGLTFSAELVAADGKSVQVTLAGGAQYQAYVAKMLYDSDLNQTDEVSMHVQVT